MQLIPAIDLVGGRCVRLFQGDFATQTRYEAEPRALLEKYRALGAAWLHVVDLDGARCGNQGNTGIIEELAGLDKLLLQAGGGLRDAAAITRMLGAGAQRCVIGSAAVTQVDAVRRWLRRFSPERIVLAFDVRLDAAGIPRVATHGWQTQSAHSLWDALAPYIGGGLRHVLCTDVGRDGTLAGPNLDLYAEAARRFPQIEWQASGGIRNGADLAALVATGAAAAISGRALLEELIPIAEMRPYLPNA
ncbi:MAG: HisA/HisF-related TIM barrel protein [Steroidobacterales bacterium]